VSGIVGIFDRSGARVERHLLCDLTHYLSFRGPDGREVWSEGLIGFGHTLLRTTRESGVEKQPACLDGRYWITADARIDCRAELGKSLSEAGNGVRQPVPDCELILRAYAAWGEECVEHLRGDFAFAIWDARQKTLFCARDHFGIKPFYYAEIGEQILFSNTLNCVRLHPDLPDELNDQAVADFLLFGLNCDTSTTTFRDIRRLPPAHYLMATTDGFRVKRYWSTPVDGRIRYKHSREYVEHFQVLLKEAVEDRMRMDRAAIFLSGGLDSGAVAATMREVSSRCPRVNHMQAYTVSYETEGAKEETRLARLTAEMLGMPHHEIPMDHLEPFERWEEECRCPEPPDDPFFAGFFDQFRAISAETRVAFSGEGADNLMHFQFAPYAKDLFRNREWGHLVAATKNYAQVRRFPWRGMKHRLEKIAGKASEVCRPPRWIAAAFAQRLDLDDRCQHLNGSHSNGFHPGEVHPVLPEAHASLSLPQWSRLFESEDCGATRCAVEVRYPFLDLRIVDYLLSLPPFPWFFEKTLLREAMVGRLPEVVRQRAKTPFGKDPLQEKARDKEKALEATTSWCEEMEAYVSCDALTRALEENDTEDSAAHLRPLCLNFWLRTARRLRYNIHAEAHNG